MLPGGFPSTRARRREACRRLRPVPLRASAACCTRRVDPCQPYRLNASAWGEGMTLKRGDYYRPMSGRRLQLYI
jgi:hypothetical protein